MKLLVLALLVTMGASLMLWIDVALDLKQIKKMLKEIKKDD